MTARNQPSRRARRSALSATALAVTPAAFLITALVTLGVEAQGRKPLPPKPLAKPPKSKTSAPTALERKAMLKALVWSAKAKEVTGRIEVTVSVTNKHKREVVLWPFLSLEPVDAKGRAAPTLQDFGRWGGIQRGCPLRRIGYLTLKPGDTHRFRSRVRNWTLDANSLLGWKLHPGEWTLKLRHRFELAEAMKLCDGGCNTIHADPAWPWHRTLETDWSTTLTVKKS